MEGIIAFLSDNWGTLLAVFYVAEKVVKLTPTDKDDIVFDIVVSGLKKVVSKKNGR
jgi:hypothetical protein